MGKKSYQSIITIILVITGCFIFYNNFSIVMVKGESMQPTYKNHTILLASKNTNHIKNGDVIIFKDLSNITCIKRVLACGKDSVLMKDGMIYVNNVKIQRYSCGNEYIEYQLSEDEYFVVGDNEQNSIDSRTYGPIKNEQILGTVLRRISK